MTEAAPVVTMQTKDNCIPESVGRLLECMQGKVVDPETGEGKREIQSWFPRPGRSYSYVYL